MVDGREPRVREEVVLAFPGPRESIVPATLYRSTWLVSSLQTLRERGHFEQYRRLLSAHHDIILTALAGSWLPMEVAKAHYDACNRLGLSVDEQLTMGMNVGNRAQGTVLSSAVKAARGAGVTPWTIVPQFHRLYQRGVNGGAAAAFKVGPKEARAEFIGCELFDIDYFRHAFRGVLLNVGQLFTEKQYIHDMPRRRRGEAIFKLQWV
jgi:hypothetical protein